MGLSFPKTTDELFDVLTTIKAEYPDSVPMSSKWGWPGTSTMGLKVAFRTGQGFFYDPDVDEVVYGHITDKYREMLQYMAKLYANDLIEKEFATMTVEQWEERQANGKTFIEAGWCDWATAFNRNMQKNIPEANWDWSRTWVYKTENDNGAFIPKGIQVYPFGPVVSSGLDEDRLTRLIEYFEWCTSEEGLIFHNFGVEGVTYTQQGNDKIFLDSMSCMLKGGDDNIYKHGLGYFLARYLPAEEANPQAQVGVNAHKEWSKYDERNEPIIWSFSEEEGKQNAETTTVLTGLVNEYEIKFVMGELDIDSEDDWNSYKDLLNSSGLIELTESYKASYAKFIDSQK